MGVKRKRCLRKGEKHPEPSFTVLPTVKKMIEDTQNQASGKAPGSVFLARTGSA